MIFYLYNRTQTKEVVLRICEDEIVKENVRHFKKEKERNKMSMEKLIASKIKEVLDERNWNYEFDEELEYFEFGVRVQNPIRRLSYIIAAEDDCFTVVAGIPVSVDIAEDEKMKTMMEFLHRVNFGMKKGCFEFDAEDGEIRFKVHVDCEDIVPSKAMIENSIAISERMVFLYGEGIVGIIYGGYSAEEAIRKTEDKILQH